VARRVRLTSGERIRFRRKCYGWSLERLARATGLSVSALSRLERDEQPVREREIQAIADALGESLADFYRDDPSAMKREAAG